MALDRINKYRVLSTEEEEDQTQDGPPPPATPQIELTEQLICSVNLISQARQVNASAKADGAAWLKKA